jgi:hypothetical protein
VAITGWLLTSYGVAMNLSVTSLRVSRLFTLPLASGAVTKP